eukprot:CAMPEP_0114586046 /NCGR_PEP_ID=MMETSP0125-20121206/9391_1 /TAXON_ID=485358 ORGANISM="Aristerostoma sp., Strain ATCC 50986" /NCGR_SAMPLE_ID=MMETSP0125 /ASSEMBLY_ACC=CAM_ASM_000245 /LENGTH=78 /DNA_ID=CAMNT_0001781335 /DNA_START=2470 /DNA_END=2706 /DNA_ORIENTATION=+
MSDELEKARTGLASEGRRAENKAVSDIWTKALKKSAILEARIGNGDLDIEDYMAKLDASIKRDVILIKFYQSKNEEDR